MSKVAISKTASNETKHPKNALSLRHNSMGSIGSNKDLLKVAPSSTLPKTTKHFRIKSTHQFPIPQLKPSDMKAPIQTPNSLRAQKVREFEPGNYHEFLKYQSELERKKEDALLLNKLITNKVENLAIALSKDRSQTLQSTRRSIVKPIEMTSPHKIHVEPVRTPYLTKILDKVQKNMVSGGLEHLLSHRAKTPRETLIRVVKTQEDEPKQERQEDSHVKNPAATQVRFMLPENTELKARHSKQLVGANLDKMHGKDLNEESKDHPKSAKERLISSIQSINHVNDSLKTYASTFLNQVQALSEYKGQFKKGSDIERASFFMSKKQRKILLSKKFRRAIWYIYDKMKLLKLTMGELCTEKIFSSRPYDDPDAPLFFKYCKTGNTDGATEIVRWNRYIVHNYDETRKTGLHWAIKRKHNRIAKMLLEAGADPNAVDLAGRNPLFMAASSDNLIGAKLLLQYRADPNKLTQGKRGILEYAASFRLKSILEKGKEVFISMEFAPDKMKSQIWKKYGLPNYIVRDEELDDDNGITE